MVVRWSTRTEIIPIDNDWELENKRLSVQRLEAFTRFASAQTGVLVPLYKYPLKDYIPRVWGPLLNAIRKHPNLHFTIVIHPTLKRDGRLDAPTIISYRRAMGYLQEFENVTVLGYINAGYGERSSQDLLDNVEILRNWRQKFNYFGENGIGPRGLDGVFIDKIGSNEAEFKTLEKVCQHIRSRPWRSRKSGFVILDTQVPPVYPYSALADIVIVFEGNYKQFINPQICQYSPYEYLRDVTPSHGLRLTLPQPSSDLHSWQFGIIIDGFLSNNTKDMKVSRMRDLINDLVQNKRLGLIFLTDLMEKDADGNKNWSLIWDEFVSMIASAKVMASILY